MTKKGSRSNDLCINSLLICGENVPRGGINAAIVIPEQRRINRMELPPLANQRRRIRMGPFIILPQIQE